MGRPNGLVDIDALRRLIAQRERTPVGRADAQGRVPPAPGSASSTGSAAGVGICRARRIDPVLPGIELSPGLHLVERTYAWPAPPEAIDTTFAGPRWIGPAELAPSQLLHFDTETTGLAGGTGTRAFMIGAGDWLADGRLRMRQLMITALSAERTMLDVFASWITPETVLVSYNGKSYDAPLLNTRYRLARRRSPLPELLHLDLLHPTRRMYRSVWPNCRLATAEHRLLGVVREDDLPGSEAPGVWLRYLRARTARPDSPPDATDLKRVLAHNDQDIRSLAGLTSRLAAHCHESVVQS
ncbi:ribonuclease H-like domain-containing protein [Alkalisalibacterium limincola]|uniref:ribonuclease H-like domain-containing protein n=1 Tax=Alkalisalibacterium limincola TaxID=2699169 RepID=UPI002106C0A5|nr:ribonuclease H-like domain-containing protein [Alkalisalibacterium limincola]